MEDEGGPGSGRKKQWFGAGDMQKQKDKDADRRQLRPDEFRKKYDGRLNDAELEKYFSGDRRKKEAGGDGVYVKPRYQNIKPEGDVDPRDVAKSGVAGGGHAGGGSLKASGARPKTMEGKLGWTARQRAMHSKLGEKFAKRK